MRRAPLAGLALAGLALVPVTASAALTTPADVGVAGAAVSNLSFQAAADGSAVVSYVQDAHVFVAVKPVGAALGAAADLGAGTDPHVAIAPDGRAVLTYLTGTGAGAAVEVAVRAPGATSFTDLPGSTGTPGATATATTIGADGRAYFAYANGVGATLLSLAPGGSVPALAATTPGTGATGVAIGTQTGGGIAWMLTTFRAAPTGSVLAQRWSAGGGAGTPTILESKSDTSSGAAPFTTSTATTEAQPLVISGDHPAFVWNRRVNTSVFITASVEDSLVRADESNLAATPAVLDTRSSTGVAIALVYRAPLSAAADASGNALVGWGSWALGGGASIKIGAAARTAGGAWSPSVDLSPLTSAISDATDLSGASLAPAGLGAARIYYTAGSKLLTAPVSALAALTQPAPTVIPVATGETPSLPSASGTGTGDTGAAWIVEGADAKQRVQVALDDQTAPAITVDPAPAPAPVPVPTTSGGVGGYNAAQRTQTFSASASDAWTGGATLTWDFGDGATATGSVVSHTFAAAGSVRVKVTAKDLVGNTATKFVDRVIVSLPLPIDPGPATTTKYSVSGAKIAKKTITTTGRKKGTTFTYTLSRAAKVELAFVRITKGYKSGKACKAAKPTGAKKKPKRCTRRTPIGIRTTRGVAGKNTFAFDGKVAGKVLKPGKYEVTIGAVASNASHATGGAKLRFTVKKA